MDSREIVDAFRKLPSDERTRLVGELWDEVEHDLQGQPLSEAHRGLLDERLRQHRENPTDVESWDKVRDDLLRDL
ncbi:MAG: addiction module protein [Proteobacteria bacterium]|nr:addiction module protein [Pseudomonadota bacterium]